MSMRTMVAAGIANAAIGEEVTLCGWVANRRDHGGIVFLDLRDASGIAQVVADPAAAGCEVAHDVRAEYVIQVTGVVSARPEGTVNEDLPTGRVEVAAGSLVVLNKSEPLPFPLDETHHGVDEALRLKYRYLDLRKPRMTRNLRVRAETVRAIRQAFDAQNFVEVETPTLTLSTPEGARDYLVPSRTQPGSFYALPQSPQLFKQLLMVGGLDRYYQIAHCWRDEDLRADRQPEFTQLDMEASFVDDTDIREIVTVAVQRVVANVAGTDIGPIPSMTWAEAMQRYGTDKPDTRFGCELNDVTGVFAGSEFRAFAGNSVFGICVPSAGDATRSRLDAWTDRAKALGAAGLVWMRVTSDGVESPVAKFCTEAELSALTESLGAASGDLMLLVADSRALKCQTVLGQLRLEIAAERGLRPESLGQGLNFLWVTDFPLFEPEAEGDPVPAHHPFTMPHPDDIDFLRSDPLRVRSLAYDLVLNGVELGSGSVRIHRPDLQAEIFSVLGIDEERAEERFGFLLQAFRFGAPPHAGFAFGVDRLVMILCDEQSLREVIAFPKTQSGADPLTGAPGPVDAGQLVDLGLRISVPKPTNS